MPRAILIAGDENRFKENLLKLQNYLIDNGLVCNVTFIKAEDLDQTNLSEALLKKPGEPILLVYNGHGYKDGWYSRERRCFYYSRLAELIQKVSSPIYFINDCCYSFSVVDFLKRCSRLTPTGLLSASPKNKVCYSFICEIIESWQRGKIYNPGEYPEQLFSLSIKKLMKLSLQRKVHFGWLAFLKHAFLDLVNIFIPAKFKIKHVAYLKLTSKEFSELNLSRKNVDKKDYYERPRWGDTFDHIFFAPHRQLKLNFD